MTSTGGSAADSAGYDVREHYTKYEYRIPMRDGVRLFGISYRGFFTAAGMIDTHPAIRAASPQAPVADLFQDDDWYHGGAFMLAHAFNSVSVYQPQSEPTPPARVTVPFDYGTED